MSYAPRSWCIIQDVSYGAGGVIHAIIKPNTTKGFVVGAVSGSAEAKLCRYPSTFRITEILY